MRESSENLATCLVSSFVCVGEQAGYFATAKKWIEFCSSEISCWGVQDTATVCWGLREGHRIINHLITSCFSLQPVSEGMCLISLLCGTASVWVWEGWTWFSPHSGGFILTSPTWSRFWNPLGTGERVWILDGFQRDKEQKLSLRSVGNGRGGGGRWQKWNGILCLLVRGQSPYVSQKPLWGCLTSHRITMHIC